MRLTQLLYSGLGGHGSVAFSLIESSSVHSHEHSLVFWGVEPCVPEYHMRCTKNNIAYHAITKAPGFDGFSYARIYKALQNLSSDVVIVHSPGAVIPAWWYARRTKASVIVVEHQANAAKTHRDHIHSRIALRLSDAMVFLTDAYLEEFIRHQPSSVSLAKCHVIPNGIDTEAFCPPKSVRHGRQTLHLGMASRLNSLRDHVGLIRAMTILHDRPLDLSIAGTGPTESSICREIAYQNAESRVSLKGHLSQDAMVPFLQDLDVYVHASFHETMSTSIMQAMSCGLPVIAYDVPGIRNMITHRTTGILVEPSDPAALAGVIREVVDNADLRLTLGENARRWAKVNYSATTMLSGYEKVFDSLADVRVPSRPSP